MPVFLILFCLYLLVTYLVGSIPTGYWLTKRLKGIDIRTVGSGSTGATNVYRTVGKWAGISVFVIDFLKGYLPVLFVVMVEPFPVAENIGPWGSVHFADPHHLCPVLAAAAVLIGHSRSIFLNFQGGKSAATGLGTLFALSLKVGLCTFGTWTLVLFLGKMVSLASIIATATCIPYMIFFGGPLSYVIYCILGFIYVTYRHKDNIKRIMAGTESKIGKVADNNSVKI